VVLQDYGADVLLPVKFDDNAAVLNLVLPLVLPVEKAVEMVKTLVSLGATTAQADRDNATALYRAIMAGAKSVIDALFEADPRGVQTAINHLTVGSSDGTQSPLTVALGLANSDLVSKLLDHGAAVHIDFETWYA
jgi:ankyrin repeat protein